MKTPTADPDERKTMSMPGSLWTDIRAYQRAEQIKTLGEALRRLVVAALRAWTKGNG